MNTVVFTPGFAPKIPDNVDDRQDVFAIGKVMQLFHLGHNTLPTGQFSTSLTPEIEGLTGALGRITSPMTKNDAEERPTPVEASIFGAVGRKG